MASYNTKACLQCKVGEIAPSSGRKITICGVGNVGTALAMCLLAKNITNELCLIDCNRNRAQGESMDLNHGSVFLGDPKITCIHDYSESANSRICFVTVGMGPKKNESRLMFAQQNADILKKVIPKLVKYSPATILIIITNPVDVMAYVAWKLSGLPKNRVIGTGTSLETSRFKSLLAERLGVAPTSINACVIGEHGFSCVPVWSSVDVAGVRLVDINPNIGTRCDEERWFELRQDLIEAPYNVMKAKGYTSWSIALVAADLASIILRNSCEVRPVSTLATGMHGIDKEVFLSLPCVLNGNGVTSIVKQTLTPDELEGLMTSAKILFDAQGGVKLE